MDSAEEAHAYDAMDHVEVNARFVTDLLARGPIAKRILDVGTGTALIPIELCSRTPHVSVVAIDLAEHMLAVAKANVARQGLAARVQLDRVDAKALPYADGEFGTVVSNSIVHHIAVPSVVLAEMWRVLARGGLLFVRDLVRPESHSDVDRLVVLYGGTPPANPARIAAFECARDSFRASLHAALTVDEVAALIAPLGIPRDAVAMTSDRHWTLAYEKP